MIGFFKKNANKNDGFIARRYCKFGDLSIAFFIHGEGIDLESALKLMQLASAGYLKYINFNSKKFVMIGFNSRMTQTKFSFIDKIEPISKEEAASLDIQLKALNWFQNIESEEIDEIEYPNS